MAAIEPNVSFGSAGRAVEQNSLESAYKPNNQPANPYFSYLLQRFLWMLECWTICQKRNGHFWTLLKERISNQSDGQVECIFIVQYIFSKLQCQNVLKFKMCICTKLSGFESGRWTETNVSSSKERVCNQSDGKVVFAPLTSPLPLQKRAKTGSSINNPHKRGEFRCNFLPPRKKP